MTLTLRAWFPLLVALSACGARTPLWDGVDAGATDAAQLLDAASEDSTTKDSAKDVLLDTLSSDTPKTCSEEGCEDDNPCTTDQCVQGTCVFVPVAQGTPCQGPFSCTVPGICNQGTCIVSAVEQEGALLWSYPLDKGGHSSTVLAGPGEDILLATDTDIKRLTSKGDLVWSAPAYLVGNGGSRLVIVVGDSVAVPAYNELVVLDIATGKTRYKMPLGGYIDDTALLQEGVVLLSSLANSGWSSTQLLAVDIASGEKVWSRTYDLRLGALALTAEGNIYASNGGQMDAEGAVVLLDSKGNELWRTPMGNTGRPAMSVDSQGAVVLSRPLQRIGPDGTILFKDNGYLGDMTALAAPDGTIIIIGSNSEKGVSWYSGEGKVLRSRAVEDNTMNEAVVDTCGVVYLMSYHGVVLATNADATPRWEKTIGSPEIVSTIPHLSDKGILYQATFEKLVALQAIAPPADTSWPHSRADGRGAKRARH